MSRRDELGARVGAGAVASAASDVAEADDADAQPGELARAERCAAQARIAASTPIAVNGLGSPEPPWSRGSPTTCSVRSPITTMSAGDVPTSSAVT